MVEAKPSFEWSETKRDLYYRTLQALCGTEAKLPYEFWVEHLQKSPGIYGPVCFSAAANNSPEDGIRLLSHVDWSKEEARDRMDGSLLSFYYDHHANLNVMNAIEQKISELPVEAQPVFPEAKAGAADLLKADQK